MVQGLTGREVNELLAFYATEPFGEWRADYRNAISIVNRYAVHTRPGATPPSFELFMPFGRRAEQQEQSTEDVEAGIKSFFKGLANGAG